MLIEYRSAHDGVDWKLEIAIVDRDGELAKPRYNAENRRRMTPVAHQAILAIKRQLVSHPGLIVFGLRPLDHIFSCGCEHRHACRPHHCYEKRSSLGVWPEVDDPPVRGHESVCRGWLGGILRHYARQAA